MRKHIVECRIEGEITKKNADLQKFVNFNYVKNIEKILQKTGFTKDEKIQVIEQLEKNIKKI